MLQLYQSHKQVRAAKILSVTISGMDQIVFNLGDDQTVAVSARFIQKRIPDGQYGTAVGGYYIQYPDGYESWSPAPAFESGYERVFEEESE